MALLLLTIRFQDEYPFSIVGSMDGTSTDATCIVDLAVGASPRPSGVPEGAWNMPTGTATGTLRSDLPQSPASPSTNGDSPTTNRVRPNLTINPHALPIEYRPRADEGHILTPHTRFYDSPGNAGTSVLYAPLRPQLRASVLRTRTVASPLHPAHPEAPEAPVSSPDGRLRGGSTSPKVPKARRPSAPHWTDALRQYEPRPKVLPPDPPLWFEPICAASAFELPVFVPAPEPISFSNVLIDGNGRARISDFGLSTLLTELGGTTFAISHQRPGTLRWTAPELLKFDEPEGEDDPPQITPSPRSDMYSFGRIMLQILTGKVPYHYCTREAQVMNAISKGAIPKRPRQELVTDRQWSFMQQCWMPLDVGEMRPCVHEIIEFVRQELVHIEQA
ncbi:hypothetical protein PAXINDRAFT_16694 [Paxillus involutus ATCC 200175]|uniref:Protein kinase domain-containing protein n=1 Tax=Paxillus involutus ATCC 200175 TaxID=664439 RepID=A0A0C9TR85_PAXIN|nr:hypothetical protein PAXINDRAFT_16694 [Paxillus involutus ATCC 200175]